MNRSQLDYILRRACEITDDPNALVIGSQAILAAHEADELPDEATRSIEADVAFWDDPDESKSDEVDFRIGEESGFHQLHGVYAQGVSVTTAVLPNGWEDRCVPFDPADRGSVAMCIEKHDLVVSKLVRSEEKDRDFAAALLRAGLVDTDTLLARADHLPLPAGRIRAVKDAIRRCASP